MNTVMIITGESSGELYGSLLAEALRKRLPDLHIAGIGGERMRRAGVELISRTSDAFGIVEAVSALNKIRAAFNSSIKALKKFKPAVLVLIDYPDFNLKVAKAAKALGIKILYYVSPQVWAWRKGRVKKIADLVDRMAVILPFEEKYYMNAGMRCEFVGHPILEEIESELGALALNSEVRTDLKSVLGFDPGRPLLSLLPGSRPSELSRHLPLMEKVMSQFKSDPEISLKKDYQFCMPLAPNTDEKKYSISLGRLKQQGIVLKKGETVKVLAASDIAVVTSGTATLQAAFLEVPMVVVYKLSPVTYHLGKRIIKVKYITLVNLLSGKEVVTELIQKRANPEEIIKELKRIIFNTEYRDEILNSYRKVKAPFLSKKASDRVADIVVEMAGNNG